MYAIEVKLVGNIWMAKHEDPVIKALFGCDYIPTPFMAGTSREEVIDRLQRLNPERIVK